MQVVNCTNAANYFHLLRTQMRLPFRKPLVVISPKKLLRFKGALSSLEDMAEGTRFLPLIKDKNPKLVAPASVKKVILCSG
jgi:2-oxoglutarate dehydrogenase E1 component